MDLNETMAESSMVKLEDCDDVMFLNYFYIKVNKRVKLVLPASEWLPEGIFKSKDKYHLKKWLTQETSSNIITAQILLKEYEKIISKPLSPDRSYTCSKRFHGSKVCQRSGILL